MPPSSWVGAAFFSGCAPEPERRAPRPQFFPERARPLAARAKHRAEGFPAAHPRSPASEALGISKSPFKNKPGSLSADPAKLLLRLHCPLAPCPRVPRVCSRGAASVLEAEWPPLPSRAPKSCLLGGQRDGQAAGSRAGSLHFRGRPGSLPRPGGAPRAGPRRAAGQGPEPREGEELVIACGGTMPTFEPLTIKQTTLVLSLRCPNSVY